MKSEIEEALKAHTLWRKEFKDILNGRLPFDMMKVSATDQCGFGRWLDNEGYRMIPSETHDEIRVVHQEFHRIAAEIIQKIKDKRFAEAKEDVSPDGALNRASMRLRELLLQLSLREPVGAAASAPQAQQHPSEPGQEEILPTPPGGPLPPQ
ncbi:MAG TPA: CZB domain-containing protein [Gallionellaceae bacterium]|nr:CZB domain-containing protein [Gallionellaceae bacterium]